MDGKTAKSSASFWRNRLAVVSNLDAKRTFLKLIDEKKLPSRRKQETLDRGSSGKVNIALDGMPIFSALPKNLH